VPALSFAQVTKHAREHVESQLEDFGHSHDNGHMPHHEHEEDGSPIPADKPASMVRVAAPTLAKILMQPTEPAPFGTLVADMESSQRLLLGFLNFKEHIPPPSIPSPGDTLPLLI
jgi:hypothetical protein